MMMPLLLLSNVLPSGAACATSFGRDDAAGAGLALDIMIWPVCLEIWSARMRDKMSMLPPGGTGMMTRIVRAACDNER